VSLASGKQCIAALREAGYAVEPVEVGVDLSALVAALREAVGALDRAPSLSGLAVLIGGER
jgi:hypothetical protein